MKKVDIISQELQDWCIKGGSDIVIPNFYCGGWEMDIFKMTPSGYIVEYEIKTSRADFFNDFKKGNKHNKLEMGELICNRFFFVVPKDLVGVDDVPSHCGLVYFNGKETFKKFEIVKSARLLHKIKKRDNADFVLGLLAKLTFRDFLNKNKIFNLNMKVKRMKKKIGYLEKAL